MVYLADAVGTQTEAIVIRGLSVGVRIPQIAVREILAGLIVGLVIAAAFVPIATVIWGDVDVAVGVGLGLLAACSIATVVAMALPWAFQRLNADPAFGSGPARDGHPGPAVDRRLLPHRRPDRHLTARLRCGELRPQFSAPRPEVAPKR